MTFLVISITPLSSTARHACRGTHPLGPLVERVTPRHPVRARLVAAVVTLAGVGILTVAASITPNSAGLGSHQQLGLPPCVSIMLLGYPCPTCGMTTAFAHAVRGQWFLGFAAHPAGLAGALAAALAVAVGLYTLVTGRIWRINWYRVSAAKLALGVVSLVLGGWLFKLVSGWANGALPMGQ